jgi:hypothetical protein
MRRLDRGEDAGRAAARAARMAAETAETKAAQEGVAAAVVQRARWDRREPFGYHRVGGVRTPDPREQDAILDARMRRETGRSLASILGFAW